MSVDALRGLDMICILGLDRVCRALGKANSLFQPLALQMNHVEWAGLHVYDVIFPLFLFLVGVSLVFSLSRTLDERGRWVAVVRVVRRSVVLFLLGVFYMGGIAGGWKNVYLAGVLQRIAEAYLFTGLIYCFLRGRVRAMAAICVVLMIGYWALLTFVPVPGTGAASYERGKNLAHYIDVRFLPGKSVSEPENFEGSLLNTMGAVANCLLGVLAAYALQARRHVALGIAGLAGIGAGLLWSMQFPIVKLLWTSSYVLVTCGISAVLLAGFYEVIEVRGYRRWAMPLVWVGMNSITLYLIANVVSFPRVAARIVGPSSEVLVSMVALSMVLVLARFLFERKIFLRI